MTKPPNIIWTAAAIGRRINRSAAYVRRTLAKAPGSPVKRQGRGNLYADETELIEFMKRAA
jgi:hypothetical protein